MFYFKPHSLAPHFIVTMKHALTVNSNKKSFGNIFDALSKCFLVKIYIFPLMGLLLYILQLKCKYSHQHNLVVHHVV